METFLRMVAVTVLALDMVNWTAGQDITYPAGYFPFDSAPGRVPPKVRKPPYEQSDEICEGLKETPGDLQHYNSLCGDLNKGVLPLNPMGQHVLGHSYPFELIKNQTLNFFSLILPVLKEDNTLPKVAKYSQTVKQRPNKNNLFSRLVGRRRRNADVTDDVTDGGEDPSTEDLVRQARGFCTNNWGMFCQLFKSWEGRNSPASSRVDGADLNSVDRPLTPCPSAVDYVTPVFARNYQGVWRYVVQIPYEGYFTQTIEVTKCLASRCHYLEGSCLSSPRWVSMLVAEIYYPDSYFPTTPAPRIRAPVRHQSPPDIQNFQDYQQYLTERAGFQPEDKPAYCDGVDDIGCFQVRLYYDWFLVPGSCKCWRKEFFAKFARGGNQR